MWTVLWSSMSQIFGAEWKILLEMHALERLTIAAFCGIIVGLEREAADKPAGIRTNALVAVGACLFTLASVYCWKYVAGGPPSTDPGRIAAQIASGIGFLGAGLILKTGLTVTGITTAATIWLVAAIGMVVGFGLPLLGITSAIITSIFLFGVGKIEYLHKFSPKSEEPPE